MHRPISYVAAQKVSACLERVCHYCCLEYIEEAAQLQFLQLSALCVSSSMQYMCVKIRQSVVDMYCSACHGMQKQSQQKFGTLILCHEVHDVYLTAYRLSCTLQKTAQYALVAVMPT